MEDQIKILIVDDEEDLLELMKRMLSKSGYKVLTATSGNKALAVLEENQDIALVLSDIKMPDGDGIELLLKIKEKHLQKPFVVIFTGFHDFSVEDLLDKGASAILMKPFDRKVIEDVIKEQLKPFPRFQRSELKESEPLFTVDKSFRSLEEALGAKEGLSIGRGGVFLRLKTSNEFKEKDLIKLNFSFNEGKLNSFKALLEVIWQRAEEVNKLPQGIGAKFVDMSEDDERFVNDYTSSKNVRSYIPKS